MSNFKSGSGDLSFGEDSDSTDKTTSETETKSESESNRSVSSERSAEGSSKQAVSKGEESSEQSISSAREPTVQNESTNEYPYFIRRRNVGDERDVRLEIFLRDKVANREGQFRSELAECLGTNEVAKTDAREFALLSAFQDPEGVAELMKKEGFGTFD